MNSHYPLSPAIHALLQRSAEFAPANDAIATRREAFKALCQAFTGPAPDGLQVTDLYRKGLNLRLYLPEGPPPTGGWPVLLYLHGGGWNMGNHQTHDWFAFAIARRMSLAIVAVDYRLAPECPYPAALEDSLAVYGALATGQVHQGLSTSRILLGGDSAGGTLAASLCMALRRDAQRQPIAQVLIYPVLTCGDQLPSMSECADAPFLTATAVKELIAHYLPDPRDHDCEVAMPLNASCFAGLPDTIIAVARIDPLRDHGVSFHQRLHAEGVHSVLYVGKGLVHGCLRDEGIAEVAALYDWLAQRMAETLSGK